MRMLIINTKFHTAEKVYEPSQPARAGTRAGRLRRDLSSAARRRWNQFYTPCEKQATSCFYLIRIY